MTIEKIRQHERALARAGLVYFGDWDHSKCCGGEVDQLDEVWTKLFTSSIDKEEDLEGYLAEFLFYQMYPDKGGLPDDAFYQRVWRSLARAVITVVEK